MGEKNHVTIRCIDLNHRSQIRRFEFDSFLNNTLCLTFVGFFFVCSGFFVPLEILSLISFLEKHSVLCALFGEKRVLYIIFIVTINSILTQLNVKKKGVKSLNINNPYLFYLQNPQFISTNMFYVLWPMTLRLDHM